MEMRGFENAKTDYQGVGFDIEVLAILETKEEFEGHGLLQGFIRNRDTGKMLEVYLVFLEQKDIAVAFPELDKVLTIPTSKLIDEVYEGLKKLMGEEEEEELPMEDDMFEIMQILLELDIETDKEDLPIMKEFNDYVYKSIKEELEVYKKLRGLNAYKKSSAVKKFIDEKIEETEKHFERVDEIFKS